MDEIQLETEHGREMYQRIMGEFANIGHQQMVERLTAVLDEAGVPGDDFESRVMYLAYRYEGQESSNNGGLK